MKMLPASLVCAALLLPGAVGAQDVDALRVFFPTGGASVQRDGNQVLDEAARLFRAGNPIVMIVSGGADTVGDPTRNLQLSVSRAQAVANGLVARGIPADRLQVMGRGTTELAVSTEEGVAEPDNRVVEITWR